MSLSKRKSEKIITCPRCAGTGIIHIEIFRHYNSDYKTAYCPDCAGKGRIVRSLIVEDRLLADNELYHIKTEVK